MLKFAGENILDLRRACVRVRYRVKFISKTFDIFGDLLVARAPGHPPAHDCGREVLVIMISPPSRLWAWNTRERGHQRL